MQSFPRLALLHALKVTAWPDHPARRHWEDEVTNFLVQAQDGYRPGMRQRLDVAVVQRRAVKQFLQLRMEPPDLQPRIDRLIIAADDLQDEDFGVTALLDRLDPTATPPAPG